MLPHGDWLEEAMGMAQVARGLGEHPHVGLHQIAMPVIHLDGDALDGIGALEDVCQLNSRSSHEVAIRAHGRGVKAHRDLVSDQERMGCGTAICQRRQLRRVRAAYASNVAGRATPRLHCRQAPWPSWSSGVALARTDIHAKHMFLLPAPFAQINNPVASV